MKSALDARCVYMEMPLQYCRCHRHYASTNVISNKCHSSASGIGASSVIQPLNVKAPTVE